MSRAGDSSRGKYWMEFIVSIICALSPQAAQPFALDGRQKPSTVSAPAFVLAT